MNTDEKRIVMERLAQHRALGKAPVRELEWLVEHGSWLRYHAGDVVTMKGAQATQMYALFSGHIVIRTDRGAGAHKIFEWRAGDVGGVMPYSRGASPPADAVAEEECEAWAIEKDLVPDLIRECPVITATLVHTMVDRARQFTSSDHRDEKLIALGKLAAGLAHELNNPASAVVRSAKVLASALTSAENAARQLAAARLTAEQFAAVERARDACTSDDGALSPVARADREDAITEWLDAHGASDDAAAQLADTGVTIKALDTLATHVKDEALEAGLQWLAACCQVRALSGEIESAAIRIHELVGAVKGFSYMDHAPTPEPVDLKKGISDVFMMLGSKTRGKSVTVALELPDDLPRAHAVGAELNQVWLNLIDNALDAVPIGGHVTVSARRELNSVVVKIADDGEGIPPDIQARIFDPFFTTKGVGKGTGLGLDIVRRLLQRHDGEVSVESVPGKTVFQVRLPLAK